ncbi:MAG TPA: chemotaxis protein CheX [Terriglobales bacterium]|jgi:chemotaxis protein CheX|nr:chemotaxis protein CheX [Terriglobales bacterium]
MSTDAVLTKRAQEEDWLPVLELAIQEVFEIMLRCQVTPAAQSEHRPKGEFTAIVGLAGALCGVLTICCDAKTASQIAKAMLGDAAESEDQVADALGEICNMVTGNFKNKLAGTDERCMLSVPSIVTGAEYKFRSLADGYSMETIVLFEESPIVVRLQLHS